MMAIAFVPPCSCRSPRELKMSLMVSRPQALVSLVTSARVPGCKPNQEFICVSANNFAWCEDAKFVETCPPGLTCDHDVAYLCVQQASSTSAGTTSLVTTTFPSTTRGPPGDPLPEGPEATFPDDETVTIPTEITDTILEPNSTEMTDEDTEITTILHDILTTDAHFETTTFFTTTLKTTTEEESTTTLSEDYEEIEDNPWDIDATPPSSCTKPGKFPDVHDCSTFHVCISGPGGNLTHQVVKCADGSHFSTTLGRCAVPERARCDPEVYSFRCPSLGRVQDPKNCSNFILCHPDGTWRRYKCPENTIFDTKTLQCSSTAVCMPDLNKFNCTQRGLFSVLIDCRQFYYCIPKDNNFVQGSAICPKNSVFNPKTSRCTISSNVCDMVQKFCTGRRRGKYPDPDDCSSFIVCTSDGAPSASYSCPYGSHFSAETSRCVYESSSACDHAPSNPCKDEGKFPDISSDCAGFYVCVLKRNTWVVQHYQCPGNSTFDPSAKRCSLTLSNCSDTPVNLAYHKTTE